MILISANKVKEMDVQIYRAESEVHWEVNQQFWSIAATRANKRHFALGDGEVSSRNEPSPAIRLGSSLPRHDTALDPSNIHSAPEVFVLASDACPPLYEP